VLISLALLWIAQERYQAFRDDYVATLQFGAFQWLSWALLAALAGALFVLAAAPGWTISFRWRASLLVSLVPLLLLGLAVYVLVVQDGPSWLLTATSYIRSSSQFALAVLVGVSFGLGFTGSAVRALDKSNSPVDSFAPRASS
jgi:hypothetical protein